MNPIFWRWNFMLGLCVGFSYFSSMTSFPQPLTREQEKECLIRYKDGDLEVKNILIEHNLRLVAHIVKKYSNFSRDTDDLISIGTIGLIKGISSFDVDKGTRLATYAARCIENEILMNIRATKKQKKEVSLEAPIGMDKEGNEISLLDVLCTDHDSVIDKVDFKIELKKIYQQMKHTLQAREAKVLEMRYGLDNTKEKTQREIAEVMGISRSYVSRIEKKALTKLNKELNKE